ncbi:MAG TPA: hypothetical protein VGI92_07685, partial [Gemmatimonadales bacterium]
MSIQTRGRFSAWLAESGLSARGTAKPALALVLLVAGCAIGPSTHPRLQPQGDARSAAPSTADRPFLDSLTAASGVATAPPALDTTGAMAWIQVLRDTQLVSLVRIALANNRDL